MGHRRICGCTGCLFAAPWIIDEENGTKTSFLATLAWFTLASLACEMATAPIDKIAARAAQDIGTVTLFAVDPALLRHGFHGKDRAMAFGVVGGTRGPASLLGF